MTSQDVSNLRINGERLWDSLMELAKIGATGKGGVCRIALTELDRQGRDLFVRWCREAGCEIRIDLANGVGVECARDDAVLLAQRLCDGLGRRRARRAPHVELSRPFDEIVARPEQAIVGFEAGRVERTQRR